MSNSEENSKQRQHMRPIEEVTERPLECTECRKPIAVWYTEIVGNTMTETCMCKDCPELRRRLRGASFPEMATSDGDVGAGLCCGSCGTTLESVRMGHPLGCAQCYEVFGEVLITELVNAKKTPSRFFGTAQGKLAHVGRTPGNSNKLSPSLRLIALNEALQETLNREDYEQAAWLRDQIKELTENVEGG